MSNNNSNNNKLDREYEIPGNICGFSTLDGGTIKQIFPPWNKVHKKEDFNNIWNTYVSGELDPRTGKRTGKNCHSHAINVLDSTFKNMMDSKDKQNEKVFNNIYNTYKLIREAISPMPFDGHTKNPRTIHAYGMYSALASGMKYDFTPIIERFNELSTLFYSKNYSVLDTKMRATLVELKQTNFVTSILTAPSQTAVTCTNMMRALFMGQKQIDKLPPESRATVLSYKKMLAERIRDPQILKTFQNMGNKQYEEIAKFVVGRTKDSANNVKGYIETATAMMQRGEFFLPRNDEMVKEATIDNVLENILSALANCNSSSPSAVMNSLKTAIKDSYDTLEYTIKVEEPKPEATVEELKKGNLIYEKEAQDDLTKLYEGDSTSDTEVAQAYDSFKEAQILNAENVNF